jgi:hypothetical protein
MPFLQLINEPSKFFGITLFDQANFFELLIRFGFNLLITFIIVWFIYYKQTRRKDYLFAFLLIGSVIFLLCFLLDNVKLQLGFAFGLFAIFGIIRYRTTSIPIKEMTYLFIIIGITVINAIATKKISYAEIIFTNLSIILLIFLLERVFLLKHESQKTILYEKIELIKPERRTELIADIEERTGLKINRIQIGRVDFLRDIARIQIFYYDDANLSKVPDEIGETTQGDDDDD